jgi:hypothetical protein
MLALATTALLLLFSAPLAIADKDYSKGGETGAYAHGPLPPPAPVEDYSKSAARPGDFFDWDDAAIGAGVGVLLALVAGVATAVVARRLTASSATEGLAPVTRAGANERRNS